MYCRVIPRKSLKLFFSFNILHMYFIILSSPEMPKQVKYIDAISMETALEDLQYSLPLSSDRLVIGSFYFER